MTRRQPGAVRTGAALTRGAVLTGAARARALLGLVGFACSALVSGCGSELEGGPDELPLDQRFDCSNEGRKGFVGAIMNDYYLWYDHIPADLDYDVVTTPEQLLEMMRYKELDHWSGMQPIAERERFFGQGRFDGYGYTLGRDELNQVRISWVHTDSPAGHAGLDRGARLVALDGQSIEELETQGTIYSVLGQPTVVHTFEELDGTVHDLELTQGEVVITSVKATQVLETSAGPVGYFMFTSFVAPAEDELKAAFQSFHEWEATNGQTVDQLIVDLRYNGGGLLSTAALLGSLIEQSGAGQPLIVETYNDRHQESNRRRLMFDVAEATSVSRVVFLTGPGTASASEQVINGLRPYTEVETVGLRSLGKPVGADSFQHCGYALAPITFHSLNADGEGDFFQGIEPACDAHDDLLHTLGDPEEAMMKSALAVIEGRVCEPLDTLRSSRTSRAPDRTLAPLEGRIPGFLGWY
jgi:carboxyl-terminal processing protease